MRVRLNRVCLMAAVLLGATGLLLSAPVHAWEDDTLTVRQTQVRSVHLNELRTQINVVRALWATCGHALPPKTWTAPEPLTAGTPIRAVHLQELRDAIQEVYTAAGKSLPFGAFADGPLQPGSTPIRTVHILQLRQAVDDPELTCCCTTWANAGCAGDGCSVGYQYQTRDCTPDACQAETQCLADCATCGFFGKEGRVYAPDGDFDMNCKNMSMSCLACGSSRANSGSDAEALLALLKSGSETEVRKAISANRGRLRVSAGRNLVVLRGTKCDPTMLVAVIYVSSDRARLVEREGVAPLEDGVQRLAIR